MTNWILRHLLVVAGLATCACSGPQQAPLQRSSTGNSVPQISARRSQAVVVGIDRYDNLRQLHFAVNDARALANELERRGFQVTLLLDGDATRQRVALELGDRLPTRLAPDDQVLVYFAGHGVSTGLNDSAMGYVMLADSKEDEPRSTGISMKELQAWFTGYAAKHVMFLADACYSGLALSTRSIGLSRATAQYLDVITANPVRFTLVAGEAGQEAHESGGHGIFTAFVLKGLAGEADMDADGLVTGNELAAYAKSAVPRAVFDEFGARQTPQDARTGTGEFVFINKSAQQLVGYSASPISRVHGKDYTFDGFKLGDIFAADVMSRPPFDKPCDNDPADESRRVMFYGATSCRAGSFPEGTSTVIFIHYDKAKGSRYNEPVEAVAWMGGTYFNSRSNFPLATGTAVSAMNKEFGAPERKFAIDGLIVQMHQGNVYALVDANKLVGFVVGSMPANPESGQWDAIGQAYHKYTPAKYKGGYDPSPSKSATRPDSALRCSVRKKGEVVLDRELSERDGNRARGECHNVAKQACGAEQDCRFQVQDWGWEPN